MTFNHLLHLKYEWHVKRKTGEVLRANDRGANSGQGQLISRFRSSADSSLWGIDWSEGCQTLNSRLLIL